MPAKDYTSYFNDRGRGQTNFSAYPVNQTATIGGPGEVVPTTPTPVDMNEEIAYTGQTRTEIARAAEKAQLSDLADFRNMQRQTVARQGSTMFEQAQMAMSERQLMSDTRGLTGGAKDFAETGLGAQQQMALAQIKNATMDQLLQIDAQSLQDPQIAQDAMFRALEIDELLNPAVAEANSFFNNAQILQELGDTDGAIKAINQGNALQAEYYGYKAPDPINPMESLLQWDATTKQKLDGLNQPEMSDEAKNARNWAIGIGVALIATGIALKFTGFGAGFGAAMSTKGVAMLAGAGTAGKAATTTAIVGNTLKYVGAVTSKVLTTNKLVFAGASMLGWQTYQGVLQADRNLSPEQKIVKSDIYLSGQIERWRAEGFTEQEIETELIDFNTTRLPALRYQG